MFIYECGSEAACFAPSGLSFVWLLTQGSGRCASSPWAVMARAFSAYFYYAGTFMQQEIAHSEYFRPSLHRKR
jgi:hypothetical protein